MKPETDRDLESVATLRRIPFVRDLHYVSSPGPGPRIDIRTPTGHFQLHVEARRSFLTRSAANQLLAWFSQIDSREPILLLARHVPRPVAEHLIDAHVNFADDAGNVHLTLGDRYNWTAIGRPAPQPASERRPNSPAQLQLLFQFATHPDSANWPVRGLELAAGISKSKAAQARRQLLADGFLTYKGKEYQLGPKDTLAERLTSGYAQVLRPKLVIGRFRFAEKSPELFLTRLKNNVPPNVRYALTGGYAASHLQRYYRGSEVSLFIEPVHRRTPQELRLLPDRDGPVTLLRAFGEVVYWRELDGQMVASPWLIYAELLASNDPRALEAAREFRKQLPA